MRIGKSKAFSCNFCGKPIQGEAVTLLQKGVESHYCDSNNCFKKHMREEFNDLIQARVQEVTRKEIKELHDCICPACRARVRTFV